MILVVILISALATGILYKLGAIYIDAALRPEEEEELQCNSREERAETEWDDADIPLQTIKVN